MYNNKIRRRKFRSNGGRPFGRRSNEKGQRNNNQNLFTNGQMRSNNFRGTQNVNRLIEKYNDLAKEALSVGDKILSENYLQHADHFSRIAEINNVKKENINSSYSVENKAKEENVSVEENNKANSETNIAISKEEK